MLKVNPENKDKFKQAVLDGAKIGRGHLGWGGQARLMVAMDVDQVLGISSFRSKKRIRIKKMKSLIQKSFIQNIMQYVKQ